MAAITPTTVIRENIGSLNLMIATFTTCSDADTWASGISGIVSFNPIVNGNPTTQASAGTAATLSGSTFTFYPGESSLGMIVWVLAKT